jgi:hypothetical protein
MSGASLACRKWSRIGFTLAALIAINVPLRAQDAVQTGLADDWSHHHAVFSTPARELDALKSGHYRDWLNVVNEPRYITQQQKRNSPIVQPTLVAPWHRMPVESGERRGFGDPFSRRPPTRKPIPSSIHKDWSMSDGTSSIAANAFPAKYSFSTTTASCNDYIVYPTGSAPTSATVIAYKNIYVGTCSGTVPTIAWAYDTAGTSTLSPVLSPDGSQVAYIQVNANIASLVILKPLLTSGGTVASPAAATLQSATNYRSCTAPCYTTVTLSGSPNDTNSAPFYVYGADLVYVGDNSGKVHKLTGVFSGTPAEATTGGWPVTASTATSPILTSPVYDSGASQLLFVGDGSGYLHSITTTGATSQTVLTSNQMVCGTAGMVDPPIVDSSTENVYVFVGDGCDVTPGNSYVNRFAAGTSINASYGQNYASFGNASTNTTATVLRTGSFDNTYYSGAGNTGNLYACVNGVLFQIPMSGLSGINNPTPSKYNTMVSAVGNGSACSPITEFYNGTQDWLFMSVLANGNKTGCTGACLYNFNVQAAGTTGSVTDGVGATGGTSGIAIDNSLTGAGESQIYYTTLSNQACTGNGTTGSGTGRCAIQTSQSAP